MMNGKSCWRSLLSIPCQGPTHHFASPPQIARSCAQLEATSSPEPLTNCARYLVLGFLGSPFSLTKLEVCYFARVALRCVTVVCLFLFELNYYFIPTQNDAFATVSFFIVLLFICAYNALGATVS
jgi:hypothetical protein